MIDLLTFEWSIIDSNKSILLFSIYNNDLYHKTNWQITTNDFHIGLHRHTYQIYNIPIRDKYTQNIYVHL